MVCFLDTNVAAELVGRQGIGAAVRDEPRLLTGLPPRPPEA